VGAYSSITNSSPVTAANQPAQPGQPKSADLSGTPLTDRASEWCKLAWQNTKSAYYTYHQMVWESILCYANESWLAPFSDPRSAQFIPDEPKDDYTPMPRVNYYSPAIDAVASIFSIPELEAAPRQDSNMDAHEVAEVADAILNYQMEKNGLREDFQQQEDKPGLAAQFFVLAGTVFSIVDPQVREVRQSPVTSMQPAFGVQCPECDTYNKVQSAPPETCTDCGSPTNITLSQMQAPEIDPATQQPKMQSQSLWDIKCYIGNPLACLPRCGARNEENLGWRIWAERMTIAEIKKRWDYDAEPDKTNLDTASSAPESQLDFYYAGYASKASKQNDECMVIQFFIHPGDVPEFPEGLYAVMCNDKIAVASPWDQEFIEDPHTKGDYLKMPTVYFGRTVAFDMVPVQKEINSYEAIIKLHGMTSASEPIVIDENTKVTEVTGRGDKIIYWRSVGPGSREPHRMQHGSLDDGIYTQRQNLKDALQTISAAVQVYRGQQPGSVTSASGIAQLRGQAEQMFSRPSANWNGMWCETARKLVKCSQAYMQEWEIAEIMGEGHATQIAKFKKADLDKLIKYNSGIHGLPKTREEKRAEMLQLFDRGALDIHDVHVEQRIFELFGETGMGEKFNKDATRARWENDQMKQGTRVTPMPEIEDMDVHFSIVTDAIKSLDFEQYPDPVKQLFIQHALETKQAIMMAMMPMDMGGQGPPSPAIAGPGAGAGPPGSQGNQGPPGPKGKQKRLPPAKGGGGGPGGGRRQNQGMPGPGRGLPSPVSPGQQASPTGPSGPGSERIA
jgi:hypothetical protein